jgi:hypothetical protein
LIAHRCVVARHPLDRRAPGERLQFTCSPVDESPVMLDHRRTPRDRRPFRTAVAHALSKPAARAAASKATGSWFAIAMSKAAPSRWREATAPLTARVCSGLK